MDLFLPAAQAAFESGGGQKSTDIVALVQVTFTGLALLVSALGAAYAAVSAARSKRAETASKNTNVALADTNTTLAQVETKVTEAVTKIDGMLVERDKANVRKGVAEGERAGEATAETLARGQREGAERERASVAAAASGPQAPHLALEHGGTEVPVKDDTVGAATKRIADANDRMATTAAEAEARVKTESEKKS